MAGEIIPTPRGKDASALYTWATALCTVLTRRFTSGEDAVDGLTIPVPATDAEIMASSGTGYVSAASLASASALVELTYAATIAVDWSAGINFYCVMTGNGVLGLPTNPQPGEWRTIWLGGDDTTPRTLTFASGYYGDLPTLTDIASNKQYLLSVYCINASHFVLKATQAYP